MAHLPCADKDIIGPDKASTDEKIFTRYIMGV
jgi:hypothetical protein